MAATTKDLALARESVQLISRNALPVAASTKIYQDTFVGLSSGNVRPLQAGDKFVGIACVQVDNSAGAAGDLVCEVEVGAIVVLAVTGVTGITDVGKLVYASDDQTATLTASSNSVIGVIRRHVSSTQCAVRLFTEAEIALA